MAAENTPRPQVMGSKTLLIRWAPDFVDVERKECYVWVFATGNLKKLSQIGSGGLSSALRSFLAAFRGQVPSELSPYAK